LEFNFEELTMAYDQKLADRIRRVLGPNDDVEERKMFGGLAFLRSGRMFVGITGDDLMVRVGPERYQESLGRPHVRPMDFTGRPMTGYVYVAPAGRQTEPSLRAWVTLGARFVVTLPAAKRRPRRKRPSAAKRSTAKRGAP
jgi:TfoX/Sxy family transcriptional regulator of competence genes